MKRVITKICLKKQLYRLLGKVVDEDLAIGFKIFYFIFTWLMVFGIWRFQLRAFLIFYYKHLAVNIISIYIFIVWTKSHSVVTY